MRMLDLCCGLGGASRAFRDRGWEVITVDIEPRFTPDIVADVRTWHWTGGSVDFVWASPPCDEFARESMPWCKTGKAPDLSIVEACRRIIAEARPHAYVIENVRGAQRWIGQAVCHVGPFYLWGSFPPIDLAGLRMRPKESYSSNQAAERALIPYALSRAIAIAAESPVLKGAA